MPAIKRRDFMALAAAAGATSILPWPAGAQTRPPPSTKYVAVLWTLAQKSPQAIARQKALGAGLAAKGWVDIKNMTINNRWGLTDANQWRMAVSQLIGSNVDAIVTDTGAPALEALKLTSTIPIVFAGQPGGPPDPIDLGLVADPLRPVGNVTGTLGQPISIESEQVGLLKQLSPELQNAGFLYNPDGSPPTSTDARVNLFRDSCSANQLLPFTFAVKSDADCLNALTEFVKQPNAGVVVSDDDGVAKFRQTVLSAIAKARVPAVYPGEAWDSDGGMVSYYADMLAQYQLAGEYVGRLLDGAAVTDLPVQAPNKYILSLNLKVATSLGITIPPDVIARSNKVRS
jgi:putative ABC transport system substrate-binding protein